MTKITGCEVPPANCKPKTAQRAQVQIYRAEQGNHEGIFAQLFESLTTVYFQHDCWAVPMCHASGHVMNTQPLHQTGEKKLIGSYKMLADDQNEKIKKTKNKEKKRYWRRHSWEWSSTKCKQILLLCDFFGRSTNIRNWMTHNYFFMGVVNIP